MKKKKLLLALLMIISIVSIGISTYAHSGRTDSSGGHKDNQNKSGLGSYHYHCGGHPAHLHTNGVCPYATNSKSTKESSSSTKTKTTTTTTTKTQTDTSSKKTETTKKDTTVVATEITIEENVDNMEIGESRTLTALITPSNTTNKTVTWQSSDQSIASVNANGEVVAKKSGEVSITASTSNGKSDVVKIKVKEEEKPKKEERNVNTVPVTANVLENRGESTTVESHDGANAIGTVVALGVLGGGGYLGYKKYGRKKE